MNAKAQLQTLESALRERGVVDVKFFFDHNNKPLTSVVSEVVDLFEAVLGSRFDNLKPLNDSAR
ncbi:MULTISPECIES: hypothetical protein [unclassified Pseudoxanthomonas]|uniref:hypothetical protein n=1 Tax=unclassified Pseudoxanthomonas TaxID=2645906 RepID=UPI00307EFDBB